jgi:hypothetical protein
MNAAASWRWIDREEDGVVSAFVATFAAAEPTAQHRLRSRLDESGEATLETFAARRAFAAIRMADADAATHAFDALSVLDVVDANVTSLVVPASLAAYAAASAGTTAAEAASAAIGRAVGEVRGLLSTSVIGDVFDLAARCGRQVVDTPHGRVIVGVSSLRQYAPTRPLAPIALRLAAIIDDDPIYQVGGVVLGSKFPPASAGADPTVVTAIADLTGVVLVGGGTVPGPDRKPPVLHSCTVFLAEAASPHDAAIIAAQPPSADLSSASVLVVHGRLVALLVARAWQGEATFERADTLSRFVPAVEAALAGDNIT